MHDAIAAPAPRPHGESGARSEWKRLGLGWDESREIVNRYFYRYKPPRPLEEIEAEIRETERDIVRMLAEVTGSRIAGE